MAPKSQSAQAQPLIRRVEVAEADTGARVLNRHLPAWVVSGGLHVIVIGFFLLFMSSQKEAEAKPADLLTTQVDEPREDDHNLIEQEPGLDPSLSPAVERRARPT